MNIPIGGYRPAPPPVPANQGLLWGVVDKPETATQTCCILCLRDGIDAALEHAFILAGYSLCMKHTQAFFEARTSPDAFVASYLPAS